MSISSVSGFLGAMGVTNAPAARQEKPTSALDGDLDEIRQKGLSAWAHEQQMEKLKERLRAEILSDRKLTEGDVAAMTPESRTSVEDEIARLIEQRLQQAMEAEVQNAAEQGKTQGVVLDISV